METNISVAFARIFTFLPKREESFFNNWVFRSTQANNQPTTQLSVFSHVTLSAPNWRLLTGKGFDMDKVMECPFLLNKTQEILY